MSKTFKRFYAQAAAVAAESGFAIQLDGKTIKTPGGRPLSAPSHALAEAIAREWADQGEMVTPATMPLTQLASTALDRVGPERAHITAELMNYAATDLLCYRAERPGDLVRRQTHDWQPLLDWASLTLDAPLVTTTAMAALTQPPQALAALERHLSGIEVWRLTAIQSVTAAAGSLVLALAMADGRISAADAFALSQLDETYQMEHWGEDYEAADRRTALAADIAAAGRFLELLTE